MGRKKQSQPNDKNPTRGAKQIEPLILDFLGKFPGRGYQIKQINSALNVHDQNSKRIVTEIVFRLEDTGVLRKLRNGSFTLDKAGGKPRVERTETDRGDAIVGTVDFVNARFAYVTPDGTTGEDIWIAADDLMGALDDDRVIIELNSRKRGKNQEGRVIEILERNRDEFVGRLEMSTRYAFVIPDFKKMFNDIFVPLHDLNGAKHNDKVILKITQWPGRNKKPEGKITRILGQAGEHNAEIHSIIAEFGLPLEFPENIEAEAETISDKITAAEIKRRKDFRSVTTFTIDPVDAKDFDDALSIRDLGNGITEVGIHIADVTHYVQQKTELEKEAVNRATSVYLVDRTIP
ncbi:MAG: ribonuclease R, partial [Roseivirga sp.]